MRTVIAVGLIILCGSNIRAADSDLFPLQGLRLGMTSSDLLKAYPHAKTAFVKKDGAGQLTEGLLLCEIANSAYWDSALIRVQEGEVQSWSYVRTKDFDSASRSVGAIHKALVETVGGTSEKKVAYHLLKQGKVRSPVFVWKFGDVLAAFTHSPVKEHQSGEPFICQLTIFRDIKGLQSLFDVATDERTRTPSCSWK
jgi:hypothetical protein